MTTNTKCIVCGKEGYYYHVCGICSKHVCQDHERVEYYDNCSFPMIYCSECWKKGVDLRDLMDKMENDFNSMIEDIYKIWRNMCRRD